MESENKILMTVDTGNSVKTISDLKKEITELKKALDQEAVGSEAAKKASDDLANAQNQLKQALKGSTDVLNVAKGSYKDLERQCEQLKLAYKSMADGIEKQNIAKKIAQIQENLKKQDAAIGDFKRNVGDYANAFGSALSSMGMSGAASFNALTKAGMGFKVLLDLLKAHPIIAALAAVILILQGLIKLLKTNEEAVERIKVALSPFVGIFNQLTSLAQTFADVLSKGLLKAAEAALNLTEKLLALFGAEETLAKMREAKEIEEEQQKIEKDRIKLLQEQADLDNRLLKLRADFKKYRNDEEKSIKIAAQIEQERIKIARQNLKLAEDEYELIHKQNAQTKSTKEELEKEAEAYQKMLTAQAELVTSSEEWNKVLRTGNEELIKQALLETRATQEAEKRRNQEYMAIAKARMEENRYDAEKFRFYQKQFDEYQREVDKIQSVIDDIDKQLDELNLRIFKKAKEEREQLIEEIKSRSQALEQYVLAYFNFDKRRIEDLTISQLKQILKEWDRVVEEDAKALSARILNDLVNGVGKEKEIKIPIYVEEEAEILSKDEKKFLDYADLLRKRVEKVVSEYGYLYEQSNLTEKEKYEQHLHDLELAEKTNLINHEEFLKAKANLDEEYTKTLKEQMLLQTDVYLNIAQNIASIFGSIADAMDETNEEQFEAAKAFNIASATISTISGAIGAYMGAASNEGINSIPYVGPALAIALGITNAAVVTAAGIANIAKISRQQFKGGSQLSGGFSGGASPSADAINAINAPLQYSTLVEGASLDEKITSQKVYVTQTDIADTNKAVVTQTNENRY